MRENRSVPEREAFEPYIVATAVRPMPLTLPAPLLRLRSDEQLLVLFRSGREDAFRLIHDRYHDRLLAYVRHMLRGNSEAEDIVQDVFLRAYGALRTGSACRSQTSRRRSSRRSAAATGSMPPGSSSSGCSGVAGARRT